jgi:23S rRNA pseudouridine1911/1915/1917 synthase
MAGSLCIIIPNEFAGQRLDVTLTNLVPELSRSGIVHLIRNQCVKIEQLQPKPSYKLRGGERVNVSLPEASPPPTLVPQSIKLDILYDDRDIIVINKSPGMVVHPAPGNPQNTLVNALLYHFPELNSFGGIERPGIVHRLDKDTSGVLVVAKNQFTLANLAAQFQKRTLEKKYLALVWGTPKQSCGEINYPIGRHPTDRKKMSINSRKGRNAITFWQVKDSYHGISFLEVNIKTGRTHQIRVHCAAVNHPILGDLVYGVKKSMRAISNMPQNIATQITAIQRQMLHAWQLSILHPRTQKKIVFKAPIPLDMDELIQNLKNTNALGKN